jgi:hypothetical protein
VRKVTHGVAIAPIAASVRYEQLLVSKPGVSMHRAATSLALRHGRWLRTSAAALLVLAAFVAPTAHADRRMYDPAIARDVAIFMPAYLGRATTGTEIATVTDEFLRYPPRPGMALREIRKLADAFASYAPVFRDDPKGPRAALLRHRLLVANYFTPSMRNTLTLRLLLEPDPVRIVDARNKQLLSESAVTALTQLLQFASTTSEPGARPPTRAEVDQVAEAIKLMISDPNKGARLPDMVPEAAAFWAGLVREWPRLSRDDRRLARDYVVRMPEAELPAPLYARLWGETAKQAASYSNADAAARTRDVARETSRANAIINGQALINGALWH